jgi:hypothetical protein
MFVKLVCYFLGAIFCAFWAGQAGRPKVPPEKKFISLDPSLRTICPFENKLKHSYIAREKNSQPLKICFRIQKARAPDEKSREKNEKKR